MLVTDGQTRSYCSVRNKKNGLLNSWLDRGKFLTPPALNLKKKNSNFARAVHFICSVCIAEQTRIIFLYSFLYNQDRMCAQWGGKCLYYGLYKLRLHMRIEFLTKSLLSVPLTQYNSVMTSRSMRWAGHVARVGERTAAYRIVVWGEFWGKKFTWKTPEYNIKVALKSSRLGGRGLDWSGVE